MTWNRRLSLVVIAIVCVICAACAPRISDSEAQRILRQTSDTSGGVAAGNTSSNAAGGSGDLAPAESGAANVGAGGTGATGGSVATRAKSAGGSAVSAATGPSDAGVTPTEIRVGTSATLSGALGFLGEEQVGPIDSYFQMINAHGGIGGRKLKLITYDDRGDPSQTLANVRKLYEQDKVIALILGATDAAADYVTHNNIPTFVFGVTAPSFASKYPTSYPMVGNMLLWTQEFVAGLKKLGVAKQGLRVGMIYDTTPLDARPYLPYLKEAWESIGAQVVTVDAFNLTDGDCTPLVLKYRSMNIDWWDFQGVGFAGCLSAAYRQGYKPNVGWGEWPTSVAGISELVGPAIDGVWGGSQGDQPSGKPRYSSPQPAHVEYTTTVAKYHPKLDTQGHYESPVTIGYWSAAKLLVESLRTQGQRITKAGINAWVSKVQNFEIGITPPVISMAPNCKTGSEVVWIAQWHYKDGVASREPATGYFTSELKDKYGGKCFLTALSDKVVK